VFLSESPLHIDLSTFKSLVLPKTGQQMEVFIDCSAETAFTQHFNLRTAFGTSNVWT